MNASKTEIPLVSIVSINYNGAAITCELLASLEKISYPNIEVIIVDNGSVEDASIIKQKYPWIIYLRSEKNLGFAGGNNLGFKQAKGKYFLMLNNDTEVRENFLEPMVNMMERDEMIGALSPKIEFHHSPGMLQFAGFEPINKYTGRGNAIGSHQQDDGRFDVSMRTSRAHGAAMMISRKAVEEIGLMADLYFLYYEEMDYCERIKNAGYSIWYCAQSKIYHKESLSTGKLSTLKTYYHTRNRILFQRRNVSGLPLLICFVYFTFISIPKHTITYLMKGKLDMLKAFYKGVSWNITHYNIYQNETLT